MIQSAGRFVGLRLLTVADIITLGIDGWRRRFRVYGKIGLVAQLWSFPIIVWVVVAYTALLASFIAIVPEEARTEVLTPLEGLEFLQFLLSLPAAPLRWATLLLMPLVIYSVAKGSSLAALISRLAFSDLMNQPEPLAEARRIVSKKLWDYLGIRLIVWSLYFGLMSGLSLVMFIVVGVYVAILSIVFGIAQSSGDSPVLVSILIVMGVLAIIFATVILPVTWFLARWSLAEIPIAIEPDIRGLKSISRSWDLTAGSYGRVILMFGLMVLVTIPVQAIAGYGPQLISSTVLPMIPQDSTLYVVLLIAFTVGGWLVGTLSTGIISLPLWQVVKAILYYDLCNRHEGFGLQLSEVLDEPQDPVESPSKSAE